MKGERKKKDEEMAKLNQELYILNALSQSIKESIDLDEILNRSLDKIVKLTDVGSAGIYLLDETEEELVYVAHRGFSKTFSKGLKRFKLGMGVTGKVALTGKPMFIEDYPHYSEALPLAIEEGLKSIAVIPLKTSSKIYGTLNIAHRDFYYYSPSAKNLFTSIGQIISSAMERAFLYSENVKRLEALRTLYSIGQEISSKLELKVILQKIMDSAIELLKAEAGTVALWDQRKQTYHYVIVYGLSENFIGKEVSPNSKGVAGEVLKRKVPVHYQNYDRNPNRLAELDSYHFKEVIGAPLIVREMVIGAMTIGTTDPKRRFRKEEIELLSNFAHQAGIAIGNAQLYEGSLLKIKQLTTLYEVGKQLSSTLDLDELLKKALQLLKEQWGYPLCRILFLDREKNELYLRQIVGKELDEVKTSRFKVGVDGIVGWVAQSGELLYIPEVSRDPRYIMELPEVASEVAIPIKVRDQVIGILDIQSNERMGFDEEVLKTLSSFCSQVSIFIENAQLFTELKQTLLDLKKAQDQMIQSEKLRALGEMASGVAHDFNNILAVILGNIQLLMHQIGQLGPEEILDRLKVIEKASKDGAETVRRIQEFTGIRKDYSFVSLDLNEILREVAVITEPRWKDQAQKKEVQIELRLELGDIPPILGNPSELREVLTNMVFNAVDAMPHGGRITLSTHFHSEGWVEVRVSDTGIGMSEDIKRRIFYPFFTTKGVGSSGLGLSVSFGIIKRHGGEILVESEIGKGTTFIIHLPKGYEEEGREVGRRELKQFDQRRQARILVIDDEDPVREILSKILRSKGYQVAVASDGEEGIERFKEEEFDLVFTDLGMPKISGWEVGKILKQLNPKIPIAMITGWGMELNREKMKENGIDLIVSKPFNFEQVIELVSEAIELKERLSPAPKSDNKSD